MEHNKIKEFLDQIRQNLQKADIQTESAEKDLIGVLTSHNQKEEKILYPWIDQSISEDARTEIIAKMEKKPSE